MGIWSVYPQLEVMTFVCENCGHVFEGRADVKDRQCSKCRGHRVYNKEEARDRILELKRRICNLHNLTGEKQDEASSW